MTASLCLKTCFDCGAKFAVHGGNQRRCRACQVICVRNRRGSDIEKMRNIARNKVKSAIKDGSLIRQPCEKCQRTPTHAHHDDYSKPLEVRWLCPLHHRWVHSGMRDVSP